MARGFPPTPDQARVGFASCRVASHPRANTLFTAADDYAQQNGFSLKCISKDFQTKGGPAFHLLLRTKGSFLVQLRVTSGKDDPKPPDLHCVAYDGICVRDNNKYTKVKLLEESDRTREKAHLVFDSLFFRLEVRIKNIYELSKV